MVGTTLSGVSGGLGYRGTLQVVNEIAPPDRRAEVASTYYVVCFAANSVPVIGVGLLTSMWGSIQADAAFAATIAAFTVVALAMELRLRSQAPHAAANAWTD